jgi:hypothetical protein
VVKRQVDRRVGARASGEEFDPMKSHTGVFGTSGPKT